MADTRQASKLGGLNPEDAEHAVKTADEAGDAKLDAEARAALTEGEEKSDDQLLKDADQKITRNQPTGNKAQ